VTGTNLASTPRSLPNCRDLGGRIVPGGARTKHGVLRRSAAPTLSAGPTIDRGWPCATTIDLRCRSELGAVPHPMSDSEVRVVHLPLITEDELSQARARSGRQDVPAWYRYVLKASGPAFARALTLCAVAPGPILIHCAAGKDRTGMVVAMLLAIVGVDAAAIERDYLRTNDHRHEIHRASREVTALGIDNLHKSTLVARPESIRAVLDVWREHPGGVTGWLLGHGASTDDINGWRTRLVDHPDSWHPASNDSPVSASAEDWLS
jgi:protein-tyrosine phosphatase